MKIDHRACFGVILALSLGSMGCNSTGTGSALGATAGAVAGYLIGGEEGALIGGVLGAAGGAVYGRYVDAQRKEAESDADYLKRQITSSEKALTAAKSRNQALQDKLAIARDNGLSEAEVAEEREQLSKDIQRLEADINSLMTALGNARGGGVAGVGALEGRIGELEAELKAMRGLEAQFYAVG